MAAYAWSSINDVKFTPAKLKLSYTLYTSLYLLLKLPNLQVFIADRPTTLKCECQLDINSLAAIIDSWLEMLEI